MHEDAIAMVDNFRCAAPSLATRSCDAQCSGANHVSNMAADLTKTEIRVQFHVRDVDPAPGWNPMKDILTKRYN